MLRKIRFRTLAVVAAALLSVSSERDAADSSFFGGEFGIGAKSAAAQDANRRNRQDRQGGSGVRNRQDGFGGQGGRNRQGDFNGQGGRGGFPSPEQMLANMTAERFERLKSAPFAAQVRRQVGEARWARWESGDFNTGNETAEAAAKAAAAERGELVELEEMTDEEKAAAEALLTAGTVPKFRGEGDKPYSIESENEYYRRALARRDDSLVPAAPIALRFYARHLFSKYDADGNGEIKRDEWEGKLAGAQALDLNGDLIVDDQELLYYLTRYAKDRTIFKPDPPRPIQRSNVVVAEKEEEVLIRPASAKYRRAAEAEAAEEAAKETKPEDALSDMSDEEVESALTDGNPALESVDDEELLGVLLSDMDASSVREYAAAPSTLVGVPVWFLARDANGDGQLTLREFAPTLSAPALALFGKLDTNADGFLSADEARAAANGGSAEK